MAKNTIGLKMDWKTLESLIDAQGPDFQLELSNAVLANFCDKYIKKIEHSPFAISLKERTEKEIVKAAKLVGFDEKKFYSNQITLKSEWVRAIKSEVESIMASTIRQEIRDHAEAAINEELEQAMKYQVQTLVEKMTAREVQRQVDIKLNEIRASL